MQFIILVGPKHSGKTTVGRELASLLSCGFMDLDECITQQSGKTPRALYIEGPEIFRKAESGALAAVFEREAAQSSSRHIIAAGGGIVDNPAALAILEKNAAAMTVFLDVPAQTAWERISTAGELPPFLASDNPQQTHRLLHERRSAAYQRIASLVIAADGKTPKETAQEIAKRLSDIC